MDIFFRILSIIFAIYIVFLLIQEIFKFKQQGKLIVKMNNNGASFIVWSILLMFWLFMLLNYILNDVRDVFRHVLLPIIWILIASYSAIQSYRGSEIREDGIYHQRNYYEWNSLRGYSWISPKELRLNINGKFNRKIVIKEQLHSEIDDALRRYLKNEGEN